MQIKIKYLEKNLIKIEKLKIGDWYDIRSATSIEMKQGEHKLIPLGICMELPSNFEAHMAPRSSTYKNFGIIMTNSPAIIDESYKGNNDQWFFSAYALRDTTINFNDRICQFRIIEKQPDIEFIEVDSLDNPDRNGHGSTGTQ